MTLSLQQKDQMRGFGGTDGGSTDTDGTIAPCFDQHPQCLDFPVLTCGLLRCYPTTISIARHNDSIRAAIYPSPLPSLSPSLVPHIPIAILTSCKCQVSSDPAAFLTPLFHLVHSRIPHSLFTSFSPLVSLCPILFPLPPPNNHYHEIF